MTETVGPSATALGAALALAWLPWVIDPGGGWLAPAVQSVVFAALVVASSVCPAAKVVIVRTAQRWVVNPVVRVLMWVGLNPLGLVLVETTGRVSGHRRRTPVGSGLRDGVVWVVAEHGRRANYVRNIAADAHVRVWMRRGLRHRWVDGVAQVLDGDPARGVPADDPYARQRMIVGRNPLRAFNAMNVRLLGADLVTVRIDLAAHGQIGADPSAAPGRSPVRSTDPSVMRHAI